MKQANVNNFNFIRSSPPRDIWSQQEPFDGWFSIHPSLKLMTSPCRPGLGCLRLRTSGYMKYIRLREVRLRELRLRELQLREVRLRELWLRQVHQATWSTSCPSCSISAGDTSSLWLVSWCYIPQDIKGPHQSRKCIQLSRSTTEKCIKVASSSFISVATDRTVRAGSPHEHVAIYWSFLIKESIY